MLPDIFLESVSVGGTYIIFLESVSVGGTYIIFLESVSFSGTYIIFLESVSGGWMSATVLLCMNWFLLV
jgi:hypothetical protein